MKNDCRFQEFCNCKDKAKTKQCELCRYYRFIDSGYGHCVALPIATVVAWCKDPCYFYATTNKE